MESDRALAEACNRVIRASAEASLRASLRIGWYGSILKEKDLFRELGYPSEREYYESCGIARSTWYRAISIVDSLRHLGREKLLSLSVENARLLSKCPLIDQEDDEMQNLAQRLDSRAFSRVVKEKIPTISFGAVNARHVEFALAMDGSSKQELNRLISRWMTERGYSDKAQALLEMARLAINIRMWEQCDEEPCK